MDSKFHSLCEPAHPIAATQLFGDNLNAKLKELDDSKKVSIAMKKGFSSQKERTDMIRNILHRRIYVGDSKKITNLSREKGESTSSKKGIQREMVAEAPITTLYVSRNYRQYLSFNLVNTLQNLMAGKTEKFRAQWSKITPDRWILRTICGYKVELTDKPDQTFVSSSTKFSKLEEEAINKEILDFT